jgi:hypothetical protein
MGIFAAKKTINYTEMAKKASTGNKRGNPNWVKGVIQPTAKVWQKGQSGNPRGVGRITIKHVNEYLESNGVTTASALDVKSIYMRLINLTEAEIREIRHDKDQPMIITAVAKAIIEGEAFDIVEKMLDRSIGKATQPIDGDVGKIIVQVGKRNTDE